MSFEFTSNIPDDVVQKMQEYFFHTIDWQDVANEVSNYIEADDLISNVSRYVMEDIVADHIDYDRIWDQVSDQLTSDVEDQVRSELNNSDFSEIVNDQVEYLLSQYDPHNGCSIGVKITLIVESAMMFLMQRKDFLDQMKSLLDQKSEDPANEETTTEKDFVPLFNPDLMGVYSVVSKIADQYLTDKQQDPSFLISLQMEMWQVFINSRATYTSSAKSPQIELNND